MRIRILSSLEDSMQKGTGASVRIYNIAKGLASLGNDVGVIVPTSSESYELVDGVLVQKVRGLCPIFVLRVLRKFFDVFRPSALYFYDLLFAVRVGNLVRDADIVQIEHPFSGGLLIPYIKHVLGKKVVVDCHDVFQALRVKHTSFYRRMLETFLERIAYESADLILTVSNAERGCLESAGYRNHATKVIPNGVNTKRCAISPSLTITKRAYGLNGFRVVVFVGNLSYIPNMDAIKLLSSIIAPKVFEEVKNVKFLVVGKRPNNIELPGIVFTGFVDKIEEILSISDVAVAPLLRGSGTRLKILEYFSCGLPVVSTTIGAEGLNTKDGVNIFIEDDPESFASRIVELLQNRQLSNTVGIAARELAETTYDWEHIVKKLEIAFYQLVSN